MLRILAFTVVASLAIAGSAFAVCPSNYAAQFLTSPSGTVITAAAVRDSNCGQTPCYWKHNWNNAAGTAHVEANGPFCFSETASSMDFGQYTSDDYVLTGPPGGPVGFQVFLHLTGTCSSVCHTFCDPFIGCTTTCTPGYIKGSLSDGTQSTNTGQVATLNNAILQLSLSKMVGEHFHLDRGLYAHSYCSSHSEITSQLEIVLPPGYALTSCYGFTASSPVSALHASWGRVKTLYR